MPKRNPELYIALAAAIAVTVVYVFAYQQAGVFPAASGLVGHGIGVIGFILMLMTEVLYSIRKQLTDARWGSMANWLRFHMVTGLVGPYMVLLHTSMKFQGLAGAAMLLTAIVVVSGLVGRYVYTAVPRMAEGTLAGEADLAARGLVLARIDGHDDEPASEDELARAASQRQVLASWYGLHVPLTWLLFATAFIHVVAALYYATLQR